LNREEGHDAERRPPTNERNTVTVTSPAPINEAVALLDRFAPSTLLKLRDELPELGRHLEAGGVAGPADPLIISRARASIAALKELDVLCVNAVKVGERRLKIQKRFVLFGGITAAVASASVIASLSAKYASVAFAGAVFSLAGSLATLISEHVGKLPTDSMSLFDAYRELTVMRGDSRILLMQLATEIDNEPQDRDETELANLVGSCNQLCRRAYELFAILELSSQQFEAQTS
jgi:hypothetical protein